MKVHLYVYLIINLYMLNDFFKNECLIDSLIC